MSEQILHDIAEAIQDSSLDTAQRLARVGKLLTTRSYRVTVTRTLIQGAEFIVEGRSTGEAEALVVDVLEQDDFVDNLPWSDGEQEGPIDVDMVEEV